MTDKIKRNYYIGHPDGFPEVSDGQVLYDSKNNNLYIDIDNERKLVNDKPEINATALDDSSALPTSDVVKNALDSAEAWKSEGNAEDVLSKDSEGNLSWVDIHNTLYWIELSHDYTYGVQWDYSSDSSVLTRTGDAENFNDPLPATALNELGQSPFDDIYPWCDIKEVNILSDGTIIPSDDSRFSYTENDVMIWIPTFYYKSVKDTTNTRWSWSISEKQIEGYKKHPGSGVYISKYNASLSNNKLYSLSGTSPLVKTSLNNYRTYASNRGNNWGILDFASWSAIIYLFIIECANMNSSNFIGSGFYSETLANSGSLNSSLYHTIKIQGSNMYRYIENVYSNGFDVIDGALSNNGYIYVGTNGINYGNNVSNYLNTNIRIPITSSSQKITSFGYSDVCSWGFIPDNMSSSSSNNSIIISNTNNVHLTVGSGNILNFIAIDEPNVGNYNNRKTRILYRPIN